MSKVIDTEEFKINEQYTAICEMVRTRSGTREWATLHKDSEVISKASDFWSNRPWYRFTYENAIRDCLTKSKEFTQEQVKTIMDGLASKDMERVNSMFGTIGAIAKIGEIMTDNKKDANDWKLRMLRAGLEHKGLSVPEDWDTLTEEEKESRLNKVIEVTQ